MADACSQSPLPALTHSGKQKRTRIALAYGISVSADLIRGTVWPCLERWSRELRSTRRSRLQLQD